jgi:hypothetical protein
MLTVMSNHRVITTWTGYCASCPTEQPLLLVSHGPQGLRGWLSGAGPEDRTLSYACGVCGRSEHVPLTESDDDTYDATLLRWPDWVEAAAVPAPLSAPAAVAAQSEPIVNGDVFGIAALRLVSTPAPVFTAPVAAVTFQAAPLAPAAPGVPVRPVVRIVGLPVQRVSATDLALAVA